MIQFDSECPTYGSALNDVDHFHKKQKGNTMAISLSKGQKISLTKDHGIKKIIIGLGWEVCSEPLDLDAIAFLCKDKAGASFCPKDEFFVFFGNLKTLDGGVEHTGDNRKGGTGDADDEQILVDFTKINTLAPDITELSILVTIYEAAKKNQTFGQLKKAYMKIYKEDGTVIASYDLDQSFPDSRSVQIGSFDKDVSTGEWNFTAIGVGFAQELADICGKYGIDAA